MIEQIILFETAKLAKEKGFNINVGKAYVDKDNQEPFYTPSFTGITTGIVYAVPTQSLLQKWLREIHSIEVYTYSPLNSAQFQWEIKYRNHVSKDTGFKTYEEALEKGLYQALLLL